MIKKRRQKSIRERGGGKAVSTLKTCHTPLPNQGIKQVRTIKVKTEKHPPTMQKKKKRRKEAPETRKEQKKKGKGKKNRKLIKVACVVPFSFFMFLFERFSFPRIFLFSFSPLFFRPQSSQLFSTVSRTRLMYSRRLSL
jgi:hypothetical protein